MATQSTVTGPIQTPLGETPTRGYIRFQLVNWDAENGTVITTTKVETPIDLDTQDFSLDLWATTTGDRGSSYKVTAVWYYRTYDRWDDEDLGYCQVGESGPYALGDILVGDPVIAADVDYAAAAAVSATEAAASAAEVGEYTFDDLGDLQANIEAHGDGTIYNTRKEGFSYVEDSADPDVTENGVGLFDERISDVEVTVGASGDFTDLNGAISYASKLSRDYKSGGVKVDILINAGTEIAEQLFIYNQDLGHIRIRSEDWEDSETSVTVDASAITEQPSSWNDWRTGVIPFIAAYGPRAVAPSIACRFTFDALVEGHVGLWLGKGGRGHVERTCGIENVGWRGLYLDHGIVYARQSYWRGCGSAGGVAIGAGIRISNGSLANIRQAVASGSAVGLYANGSRVTANDCDFSGAVYSSPSSGSAPGRGMHCGNSATVFAENVDCSGADVDGIYADGGARVYAYNADCSASGQHGVNAESGAFIDVSSGDITDATGRAVNVVDSIVMCPDAELSDAGDRTIGVLGNSVVRANGCTVTSGPAYFARIYSGGELVCRNSTIEGEVQVNSNSVADILGSRDGLGGFLTTSVPANITTSDGLITYDVPEVSSDAGDASYTLDDDCENVITLTSPLTGNRSLRLPDVTIQRTIRFVRQSSATGAYEWRVSTPGGTIIKALAVSEWATFSSDGTSWIQTGYGAL